MRPQRLPRCGDCGCPGSVSRLPPSSPKVRISAASTMGSARRPSYPESSGAGACSFWLASIGAFDESSDQRAGTGVITLPRTRSSAPPRSRRDRDGHPALVSGVGRGSACVRAQPRCRSRGSLGGRGRGNRPYEQDASVASGRRSADVDGGVLRERGRRPRPAAWQAGLAAIRGECLRFQRRLPRE